MAEETLRIVGSPGSPYSMKMLAALRYRNIPYQWMVRNFRNESDLPPAPVDLIPVILLPHEKTVMIDSTPILRRLEEVYEGRSLMAPSKGMRFLDALLEDYGDEWMTKAMFYYRWSFDADIEKARTLLPRYSMVSAKDSDLEPFSKMIAERQIGRLALVGCNAITAPVIEKSYEATLLALSDLLEGQSFVMGERPGVSDFGIYGQLSQLALFDPTSMALAHQKTPRVVAWCHNINDLSGRKVGEEDWIAPEKIAEALRPLLSLVGRYYAPFLLANAAALEKGDKEVHCTIDGREWKQDAFRYQGKCLQWLREDYASLEGGDKSLVDQALEGTGADILFTQKP